MQTNASITTSELRKFGLMFGAMIVLMFGMVLPWLFDFGYPRWPLYTGGGFACVALIFPACLRPVYWMWMHFAHVLGAINTRIILFLIFAVLFVPIGILLRMFNSLQFEKTTNPDTDSYLVPRTESVRNMERPF